MPRRSPDDTFSSALLPLTSLNIGLWESDVAGDCIRGDVVMAQIFGLSSVDAARGISIRRLLSIFHPEDLAADTVRRRQVHEEGGLFVWEHRILPAPGIVRWALARGHFERDLNGRMRGRGIIIDVTDTRAEGGAEGSSRFLAVPAAIGTPVERMAERALELWELMHELEAGAASHLEPLLQALMLELGRQIASSLPEGRETEAAPSRHVSKFH
ncbi:PAS domain-containing protein [Methylobacterium sp. GC_Met_2]|uniref:PAS domain-containing protein n=1 Tax=Methylobacterium sp. GC_Met_2 TaxID=2937376 RepID=UPI00226B0977|nr:PAS domain-containing protein [Methylobacterium sp. GC_Met_2]